MPLYEYQCPRCGRFEVIRKFSDAPLTVCPTCGKKIQKLFSAPAIQFKGAGWYVTDYARKPPGGDGAGKPAESASSDSSGKDSASDKDSASSGKDSAPTTPASKDSPASGSGPSK